MQITFFIEYFTRWGQQLFLSGNSIELGHSEDDKALPMHYLGNGQWVLTVTLSENHDFTYRYFVRDNGVVSRREWGGEHHFCPIQGATTYRVYDSWQDIGCDKTYISSAFLNGKFIPQNKSERKQTSFGVRIEVVAPELMKNEILAIVGSFTATPWSIDEAIILENSRYPIWTVLLPTYILDNKVEYKFVILDKDTNQIVSWEDGPNRQISIPIGTKNELIIVTGMHLRIDRKLWRGAGVAIPIFSLRSESSWGIGEFLDLEKMVDWASETTLRIIQILPINDTTMWHTWLDSYPYRANSIYALHPIYLNLPSVGRLRNYMSMQRYESEAKRLNELSAVDYEAVANLKYNYLQEFFFEQGEDVLISADFQDFFNKNKNWLVPYSVFCYLRDRYKTPVFTEWGEYASYDISKINRLLSKRSKSYKHISLHYFIQYHLHKQLTRVRKYALSKGVVLKGDIPIGISRDSVDAWVNPQLFNFDSQAGAPPDDFSVTGQNWGFPTYNWLEMSKDGYAWWKARFTKMSEYFDAYRIDHILGFFRIWEIPCTDVEGLPGHFNAALPYTTESLSVYGFNFDEKRHARPYIREYMLSDIFGEYAEEVKSEYLSLESEDIYVLKDCVNTQQKIQTLLGKNDDEKAKLIQSGLFKLTDEVLFVKDPYMPCGWHPRISAQETDSFKALAEWEQHSFCRLHDDFYYARHNTFWKEEALKKLLPLVSSTNMLVCGEDLGMIPQSVPEVMKQLQILSLEIERMPKESFQEFGNIEHYPYLSVCTTSTHDMSGIRGWWEEDRAKTQRYYNRVLNHDGIAPEQCPPYICLEIVKRHLQSPSILAILPLQDWLSVSIDVRRENFEEERINVPSNPRNYWHYRMHISLENLLQQKELNETIRRLVAETYRNI